jgi:WD40 repeat protein
VNASAFFYDGRRIVTGSGDKTLRVWAAQKGTLLGEPFEAHQGSVLSNAYSPQHGPHCGIQSKCSSDRIVRVQHLTVHVMGSQETDALLMFIRHFFFSGIQYFILGKF